MKLLDLIFIINFLLIFSPVLNLNANQNLKLLDTSSFSDNLKTLVNVSTDDMYTSINNKMISSSSGQQNELKTLNDEKNVENASSEENLNFELIKNTNQKEEVAIDENEINNGKNDKKDEISNENCLDNSLELCDIAQDFWNEGNAEKAFESLDQAYSLILKIDNKNNPKLIQQKEDLRFLISKRILEIHTSRYRAANGLHKAIPLTLNKYIEKEIENFQTRERSFFLESYKRSGYFREKIVAALKNAGLPEELSWLPLIESGFKLRALSRARALGLWQFIPSTGYKFGLKRDDWIDERLDPDKATVAAIAYLKELHNIFGDWTTVLAGYNCGESAVLRKIRRQKINYLDNFWDLYEELPRETARYVPRFIAVLRIINDPEKYGFDLSDKEDALQYDTATIDKSVHLKTFADSLDIPYELMLTLNPELRHQATPDSSYILKIPVGKKELFLTKLNDFPKWSLPESAIVYHRVKTGENLSSIALKYRSSVTAIVRANHIRSMNFIRAGQKLIVPIGNKSGITRSYELLPDGTYQVRKGDSLWLIAKMFNTSMKKIIKLNNLNDNNNVIYVNQKLIIAK